MKEASNIKLVPVERVLPSETYKVRECDPKTVEQYTEKLLAYGLELLCDGLEHVNRLLDEAAFEDRCPQIGGEDMTR